VTTRQQTGVELSKASNIVNFFKELFQFGLLHVTERNRIKHRNKKAKLYLTNQIFKIIFLIVVIVPTFMKTSSSWAEITDGHHNGGPIRA